MKKYPLLALILTLAANLAFTACDTTNDTPDYEMSRDCIITAATMGTLNRPMHTFNSNGEDSTYVVKITGSLYPMYIDQLENKVYNADSLPVGTDVTKVAFSELSVRGNATIRSLYTQKDTILSLKDSIDCSVPRIITVTSENQLSKREYTLEVRVHRESPDSFNWQRINPEASALMAGFKDSRALCIANELYLFGQSADGKAHLFRTSATAPAFTEATEVSTADGQALDVRSVQYFKDAFYALGNGKLVSSTTGEGIWTATQTDRTDFDLLAGCSHDSLYAIAGGKMFASADALHWIESATDTPDMLPDHNVTSVLLPSLTDEAYEKLLLTGNRGEQPAVWKLDIDRQNDFAYSWMLLPQTEELGKFGYPNLNQPCMAVYDKAALLCGVQADGKLAPFYVSRDNGRTWKTHSFIKHPDFEGATGIALTVDTDNFVWVFCQGSGAVYKGRLNRLGWDTPNDRFEKSVK